jgi:hypothetical protein
MIKFICDMCGRREEPNQISVRRVPLECPNCFHEYTADLGPAKTQTIRLPEGWEAHNSGNNWQIIVCDSLLCQSKYKRQASYKPSGAATNQPVNELTS